MQPFEQTEAPPPRGAHPVVLGLLGLALLALAFGAAWLSSAPEPSPTPEPELAVPAATVASGASPKAAPSLASEARPTPLPARATPTATPSASVEAPPLTASTPIALGTPRPPRVPSLPIPTWGRYVPADPAVQVEPPSLYLDGPEEPTRVESAEEAYAEGLRRLGLGKDGIPQLEGAANGGHLEAAFLAWLWQPNSETGKRLAHLVGPEARARLVRSLEGSLPQALWLPVSREWIRTQQEKQAEDLTSGDAERVRSALPSSMSSEEKAKLLEFYVKRRPSDLQIRVERVDTPKILAQSLELDGERLYLRTQLSVVVATRMTFTQDSQLQDRPGTTEMQLNLRLPLEPLGDW